LDASFTFNTLLHPEGVVLQFWTSDLMNIRIGVCAAERAIWIEFCIGVPGSFAFTVVASIQDMFCHSDDSQQ